MSKRLQVVVDETELSGFRRAANSRGMTMAEWVRQVLRSALRDEPEGDIDRKLEAVRAAVRHQHPAPGIEQMLEEIEAGYRDAGPE